MRSSTPDAPPDQVPTGQTAPGAPAAGNDRPTALTAKLVDLASYTAGIAAAILGCPF